MPKKISGRCGKGNCEFYDKNNKISGCSKFTDRKECELSMKHRRKIASESKSLGDNINWYNI